MSRTIARLLLSILLMPLMAVVYIATVALVSSTSYWGMAFGYVVAGVVTVVFTTSYWITVWFGSVRWRAKRITYTAIMSILAAGGGVLAHFAHSMFPESDREFGQFLAFSVALLTWLIATVFLWRETPSERAERLARLGAGNVSCPACGYNLTGLKSTTCPECGASFSIQELVAAAKGIGELEG